MSLYVKNNRRKYKGFFGDNGYYSFEYGYVESDGTLSPVGTEADVLEINIPVSCDYIDKDVMVIWSRSDELQWEYEGISTATVIERKEKENG